MALDHALMAERAATGEAVLRVYEWASPVLRWAGTSGARRLRRR
jgi:hypothetical protein